MARPARVPSGLHVDFEIVRWMRTLGPDYETRINQILRREMETDATWVPPRKAGGTGT